MHEFSATTAQAQAMTTSSWASAGFDCPYNVLRGAHTYLLILLHAVCVCMCCNTYCMQENQQVSVSNCLFTQC